MGVNVPEPGSVGQVELQMACLFTEAEPLVLANGEKLGPVEVAFETYGNLNDRRDNAVFILHALTGDAHAAGYHAGAARPGWWDNLIGPGKPLDTDRFFVICANLLGGCQGTTGPSSINPATGSPFGLGFPQLTVADLVEVHRALLRHLGISRLLAALGGSLGGMQALQWGLSYPEEVANGVVVAASSRLTAQNIAFSAVARRAIMTDPNFLGGDYVSQETNPDVGLAIARMMAHITYLSEDALTEKFGREPHPDSREPGFGIDFAVESYLDHQGQVFLGRFDALSYLYLSRVMDYFDPFSASASTAKVTEQPVKWLVMSFDTDWRFGTEHSRRIVRRLELAEQPVTFREIQSPWGHDSFLLEVPSYHATLRAFLDRALVEVSQ
ncbi:homoserine O-acetyltransferase [Propionicimonas sp.]|uniref:homoserine O-acetyltransferase MetX n=2 Tax=Propionicimonas sp. TaxID=1955623 RepID=UPI0017C220D7|nr:homoserine O-acetyltransferase [Propionicimonas sp.]MBU3977322.1 homoserine O-acetyltransferase [Actinomycetota bacterium]MBA3021247.1 homoserine O-acetyltransferase [Propionicimonas sp.]MBU3985832.1 homoserine O-acetyltransferase [Actinomycetota bacterium]MBU4008617.1 homoserine O-acetyltransferase [Actinomycetota bacterium]MBU4066233.1 homoserine O-acetyltransferase [Actinomycetota bacterium]